MCNLNQSNWCELVARTICFLFGITFGVMLSGQEFLYNGRNLTATVTFLHDWQDLAAGIIAFSGAIGAVIFTLKGEQRKAEATLMSVRMALFAEIFQQAVNGFDYYQNLKELENITIYEVEAMAKFTSPIIYPNVANNIGQLGNISHDIVLFYAQIQFFEAKIEKLRRYYNEMISHDLACEALEDVLGPREKPEIHAPLSASQRSDMISALRSVVYTGSKILPDLMVRGSVDEMPVKNFINAIVQEFKGENENALVI